jgi:hypothetical protein
MFCCIFMVDRDSVVDIATLYELEGPGIESRWKRDFPHISIPALGPTQPPAQWIPCLFSGGKATGRDVDHLAPPSAEVKERVELHLLLRWTFMAWSKVNFLHIYAIFIYF